MYTVFLQYNIVISLISSFHGDTSINTLDKYRRATCVAYVTNRGVITANTVTLSAVQQADRIRMYQRNMKTCPFIIRVILLI
jgi:uncharacterized protein YcsI (UPF0317 family)